MNKHSKPMKIVCLGDSLTKGYKLKKGEDWVSIVAAQHTSEWINHGILGDTSTGLVARLEKDFFSHHPNQGIFMAGTNDFIYGVPASVVKSNMACIVHHCRHHKIKARLGVPILIQPEEAAKHWGASINFQEVNRQLMAFRLWLYQFQEQFSCEIIDFQEAFLLASKSIHPDQLYSDGLHPTKLGNQIMSEILLL